jgi:hypothetical protein
MSARDRLRASNGQNTTGCPQVLDRSVTESIHLIFIGPTRRSCLQPQIRIEIQMGRRIVPISLLKVTVICIIERKNKLIKLNEIIT